MADTKRLALSPEEAAESLGLGKSTVYKLIRAGVIPTTRLGGGKGARLLVPVAALEKLLKEGIPEQPKRTGWLSRERDLAHRRQHDPEGE